MEVAITVDGLAGLGNELQVYGAFVAYGNLVLALTFGTLSASCSKQDHSIDPGTDSVFVRIAQTDKDGKTTYSKVLKAVIQ